MSKLISLIAIPLGFLIALKYFGIYDASPLIPYNLAMIGALFLIATQIITHIIVRVASKGSTFMGKVIHFTLALPGIIYLINLEFPLNLGFDLEIVIAAFLFTEGIYAMH